jgi:hypothetical protein
MGLRPREGTIMDHSKTATDESAFPALFVMASTFIGALVWLCVMLASVWTH